MRDWKCKECGETHTELEEPGTYVKCADCGAMQKFVPYTQPKIYRFTVRCPRDKHDVTVNAPRTGTKAWCELCDEYFRAKPSQSVVDAQDKDGCPWLVMQCLLLVLLNIKIWAHVLDALA